MDMFYFTPYAILTLIETPYLWYRVLEKLEKIILRFQDKDFLWDWFLNWLVICLTRVSIIMICKGLDSLFPLNGFIDFNFLASKILNATLK